MSRSAAGRRRWRRAVLMIIGALLAAGIIATSAAAATPTSSAQISTYAGGPQPGPAPATSLGIGASGVATSGGNLFITDVNGDVIREVSAKGVQVVTAGDGSYAAAESDRRPATTTGLSNPTGVAIDPRGDQLIADEANERVRLVAASSCSSACPFGLASMVAKDIYTVAGNGTPGYSGDGGPATAAELHGPTGVATDARGDVLLGDAVNNRVRIVAASACTSSCPFGLTSMTAGDVYTIAGNGNTGYTGDGGLATAAAVYYPVDVTTDPRGDVLIAENIENRVRIVATSSCSSACPLGLKSMTAGHIYLVAGDGTAGDTGDQGPAASAELSDPYGVGVDAKGNLLIADSNNAAVRMVATSACSSACPFGLASTVTGDIYTVAHTAAGYPAFPTGVTADSSGDLLIGDNGSASVRMVAAASCSSACPFGLPSTTAGQMYVVAGNGSAGYSGDSGAAAAAGVSNPRGVGTDSKGDVLIADSTNNRVRMVAGASCSSSCPFGLAATVKGRIYTVAGNGNIGYSGDAGPATSAEIWNPTGVAVDAKGNLFIADSYNARVRMVAAASCSSACPLGLPSTTRGDIYTVAGTATPGYSGDGGRATSADFNQPEGVAVDSKGDLIIGDTLNNRVRLVAASSCTSACPLGLPATSTGDVYTVAGGGSGGLGDGGSARSGTLALPTGVAVDAKGNLVIADVNDGRVRLVAAAACSSSCPLGLTSTTRGDIYTVAGGGTSGLGDGGPATSAALGLSADFTSGVALDAKGDLLIGDPNNNRVRLVANASCSSACPLGLSATTRGDIYTVAGGGTSGLGDRGISTAAELAYPSGVAVNAQGDLFVADAKDNRVRIVAIPPHATAPPVISGTLKSGQTLTTTAGTWTSPSPLTYTYAWTRCTSSTTGCGGIAGATSSTYQLTSTDVGHYMLVAVIATDQEGQSTRVYAKEVGPVTS